MILRKTVWLLSSLICSLAIAAEVTAPIPPSPAFRIEETLVSYRGKDKLDYLAFPAIVPSGDKQILLSYKRGQSHARDIGAVLEIIRVDLKAVARSKTPFSWGSRERSCKWVSGSDFPMARSPLTSTRQVVDSGKHTRTGLLRATSRDNGKSFEALERVGVVDGVEYGYLFDSATVGKRVYAYYDLRVPRWWTPDSRRPLYRRQRRVLELRP